MTLPAIHASWTFEALGVPWRIDTPGPLAEPVRARIGERIERFDRDWSRFRADSLVTRMSQQPGRYRLPDEAATLRDIYRMLYDATGGRVSPLVGHALESLGYDAAYRLVPERETARVPAWTDAIAWDETHLTLLTPALLDVGAAGKGLLVDLVLGLLVEQGIPDAVVDASGDLARRGRVAGGPERIALEHPGDPERAVGVVELDQGALCGSASNRRAWANVHHIIDALTGHPVREVIATWVVADSAAMADGLATGLFFAPAEAFSAAPRFEWVRMFADGRIENSASFPGEVFR